MRPKVIAALAAVAIAVGAAPAAAQTPDPNEVPTVAYAGAVAADWRELTVPRAVTSGFDTAQWSLDATQQAPATAIDAMQDAAYLAVGHAQQAVTTADTTLDEAESHVDAAKCWLYYGEWSSTSCPFD